MRVVANVLFINLFKYSLLNKSRVMLELEEDLMSNRTNRKTKKQNF